MPLDEAFWSYAVIGGIAVNLTTSVLFFILIAMEMLIAAFAIGYVLSIAYNIIVSVGVWRSAGSGDVSPRKASVYRTITLVGMTLLSLT